LTLQDIINAVNSQVTDDSITQSDITRWANWAQQDLSQYVRTEAVPLTVNLTQGQTIVPFPSDCLPNGIRKILYTINGITYPVKYVGKDDYDWIMAYDPYALDEDHKYAVWDGQIYLYPAGYGNDSITIYYYKTIPDMVNLTDVSQLPVKYHELLVVYCFARAEERVEEFQMAAYFDQRYEQLKTQMKAERSRDQRDAPNRIRPR
jgi:hypothetical protein